MSEPVWLTTAEIIEINSRIVARSEEPSFVKDWPALESAADRPRNAFAYGQDDIVHLAALTAAAIAQNHPFMQGNKRTALIGMQVFLQNNGYTFQAPDTREVSQLIYDVVEHRLDIDGFADAIDQWIVELDGDIDSGLVGRLVTTMPTRSISEASGEEYRSAGASYTVRFATHVDGLDRSTQSSSFSQAIVGKLTSKVFEREKPKPPHWRLGRGPAKRPDGDEPA